MGAGGVGGVVSIVGDVVSTLTEGGVVDPLLWGFLGVDLVGADGGGDVVTAV